MSEFFRIFAPRIFMYRTLLFLSILALSCKTPKYSCTKENTVSTSLLLQKNDSVVVRDTIVGVPADTAEVVFSIPTVPLDGVLTLVIDTFPKVVKSKHATVRVQFKDNKITATAICDSVPILVKQVEKYQRELMVVKDSLKSVTSAVKTEYKTHTIDWVLRSLFGAGLLWLFYRMYKFAI